MVAAQASDPRKRCAHWCTPLSRQLPERPEQRRWHKTACQPGSTAVDYSGLAAPAMSASLACAPLPRSCNSVAGSVRLPAWRQWRPQTTQQTSSCRRRPACKLKRKTHTSENEGEDLQTSCCRRRPAATATTSQGLPNSNTGISSAGLIACDAQFCGSCLPSFFQLRPRSLDPRRAPPRKPPPFKRSSHSHTHHHHHTHHPPPKLHPSALGQGTSPPSSRFL